MTIELPQHAKDLLDAPNHVVVGTLNPDGSPQTSVLWATYDGDDILLSTIKQRAKYRNWVGDPRTSVTIIDESNPYTYVEVRGVVGLTEEGGPELIEALSQTYLGKSYTNDEGTDNIRVVARLTPAKVSVRE
ncbi:MAG TPA: PPOX class F420-dependent oxidoreductase [Jatrophihabitans sp.]